MTVSPFVGLSVRCRLIWFCTILFLFTLSREIHYGGESEIPPSNGFVSLLGVQGCCEEFDCMCGCTCTAPWIVTWSSCSGTCGTGSKCPSITCSNDGHCSSDSYPDSSCVSCSLPACPPAYTGSWSNPWGSCPCTCGGCTQYTSPTCSNGNCDPAGQPSTISQTCGTASCYPGSWSNPMGACPCTCGGCTQYTNPTCSGGACNPATQPSIGSATCGTASCYPGVWGQSGYGSCSVTCGGGSKSTTVTCTGGACNPGTQPSPLTASCNTNGCGYWVYPGYGSCSTTCGPGTKDNVPYCTGGTCDAASPGTISTSCNLGACTGPVDSCAPSGPCNCVTGSQPVSCHCGYPVSCTGWIYSQSCSCTATCSYGSYSPSACSGCGPQTLTRPAFCTWSDSQSAALSSCGGCPSTTFTCSNQDCYSWHSNPWGACTVTCGWGTQTRTNWCTDDTTGGNTVGNALCTSHPASAGAEPALTQNCNPINCFQWQYDSWSSCSVTCSHGINTRNVWCQDITDNHLASDASCFGDPSLGPKPSLTMPCFTACTNNYLASFTTANQISFPFVKTTMSYLVQIPWDYTTTTATAAKEDPTATLTWQVQTVSSLLYPVTKQLKVTVTSEAGVDRVYTVDIQRRPSYNAYLDDITASVGTFGEVINAANLIASQSYTLLLQNIYTSVSFGVHLADPLAVVTGWNPASTISGITVLPATHPVTVSTMAEDGITTKTYTIVVSRLRSSIATLAALDVTTASTARLFPTFLTGTLLYSLSGRLGPSITQVVLRAQLVDNTASLYYKLTWSGGNTGFIGFSDQTNTPINIYEGDLSLNVKIIAEDGTTVIVYTAAFYKVSSDTALQSMTQNIGTINTPVVPATMSYVLTLPYSATSITLAPAMRNIYATAVYSFQGTSSAAFSLTKPIPPLALPSVGDYSFEVRVTSENLVAYSIYDFVIHRKSNDGKLANLFSNQADFTEPYQQGLPITYRLNLPAAVTSLVLNAIPTYSLATLEVKIGAAAYVPLAKSTFVTVVTAGFLAFGDTTVLVRVTAEDATPGEIVTLLVHRLSNDASLTGLSNTAQAVTITAATSYTLTVAASLPAFNFQPISVSSWASFTYTYGSSTTPIEIAQGVTIISVPLASQDNILRVMVVSEDGSAAKAYTFTIHKSSSDATLKSLSCTAPGSMHVPITPVFSTGVFSYTATVPAFVPSVTLTSAVTVDSSGQKYAISLANNPAGASYTAFSASTLSTSGSLTLQEGENYLFLRVASEDSSLIQYYTITLHKQSAISALTSMSVVGFSISPGFAAGTLSYTVTVPPATATATINFARTSPVSTAAYRWNAGTLNPLVLSDVNVAGLPLLVGSNQFVLTISSEDVQTQTIYHVTIKRLSNDKTLQVLSFGSASLAPSYDPAVTSYTTIVQSNVPSTLMATVPTFSGALLQYSTDGGSNYFALSAVTPMSLSLSTGVNTVLVKVTAEDTTNLVYTISITRLSAVAGLTGVTNTGSWIYVAPGPLSFSAGSFQYVTTVGSGVSTISVTTTRQSSTSTTEYVLVNSGSAAPIPYVNTISSLPLSKGGNTLRIIVTAEDLTTFTEYIFVIRRMDDVSSLASLIPAVGAMAPQFAPAAFVYTLALAPSITQFILTAVGSSPQQTLFASHTFGSFTLPGAGSYIPISSGFPTDAVTLPQGNSVVTVKVVAEDGSSSVYQIRISRISDNAGLGSLTATPGTLTQTGPGAYTISAVNSVSTITFIPTTTHAAATMSYTFLPGSDLVSLLPLSTYTCRNLVTASIPTSDVQLPVGDSVLIIRVLAEDLATSTFTTILIHRISIDTALSGIILNPALSDFNFVPTVFSYSLTVPNSLTLLHWELVASSAEVFQITSQWNVNSVHSTAPEVTTHQSQGSILVHDNTLTIVVTAESGDSEIYVIEVHRTSNVAVLTGLTLTPGLPGFAFAANTYQYGLFTVTSGFSQIQVTASVNPLDLSTISYTYMAENGEAAEMIELPSGIISAPPSPLQVTTNVLIVTVLAEDGVTATVYTIRVRRPSTICSLSAFGMVPSGSGFVPWFTPATFDYSQRIPFSLSDAVFTVLTTHAFSTPIFRKLALDGFTWNEVQHLTSGIGSNVQSIPVGISDYQIFITAEDGVTTCEYELTLNRLSNDASIQMMSVIGLNVANVPTVLDSALSPLFQLSQRHYTLSVPNSIVALILDIQSTNPMVSYDFTREMTASRLDSIDPQHSLSGVSLQLAPGITYLTARITSQDESASTTWTVTVTRTSDLNGIRFWGQPNGLEILTTPVFTPGQPRVAGSVAYKVESFCVSTLHTTPSSDWKVHAIGTTAAISVDLPASGTTCSGVLPLATGETNHYVLDDPIDPDEVELRVFRANPVMSYVGWTVDSGATFFLPPAPSFKSHIRSFIGSTVFVSSTVNLLTHFTSGTLLVSVTGNAAFQNVPATSDVKLVIPLSVGVNTITLIHSLDGIYTVVLNRAIPDVINIRLDGVKADNSIDTGIATSPSFLGGHLGYTATVSSVYRKLILTATFNTVQSLILTHTLPGGLAPQSLFTGTSTSQIILPLGLSTFTFASNRDGSYIFDVTRGDADVGGIILSGEHWDGTPRLLTFTPSFTPGVLGLRKVTVPKAILGYTIQSVFNTAGSLTYFRPSENPVSIMTSTPSDVLPLGVGSNTVNVASVMDGSYTFEVKRDPADIMAFVVNGVAQEGTEKSIVMTPPVFNVATHTYTANVPYRTHQVTITNEFLTPASLSINGALAIAAETLTSGVESGAIGLAVGVNTLTLSSGIDGDYSFVLTRLPSDLTVVSLDLVSSTTSTYLTAPITFTPTVYSYTATVSYATSSVNVAAIFGTPLRATIIVNEDAVKSLSAGVPRSFELEVGENAIEITHVDSGIYVFTIIRQDVALSSIAVEGFSGSPAAGWLRLFAPTVPNVLTPAFAPGITEYSLTVGSNVVSIRVKAESLFPSTNVLQVSQSGNSAVQHQLLNDGVESIYLIIGTGENVFTLSSLFDGDLTLRITRSSADLLKWVIFDEAKVNVIGSHLQVAPTFSAGTYVYTLDVPYGVESLLITCVHVNTDSDWTMFANGGGLQVDSAMINRNGSISSEFPPVGIQPLPILNQFRFRSLYDAEYTLTVRRAVPDIHQVNIQIDTLGDDQNGQAATQSLPSSAIGIGRVLTPPFDSNIRNYTQTLPFTAKSFHLAAAFLTPMTNFLAIPNVLQLAGLASGEYSPAIPLAVGAQLIILNSVLDGAYWLTVTRLPSDVNDLTIEGVARTCIQNGPSPCTPQSLALSPVFVQATSGYTDSAIAGTFDVVVPWVTSQVRIRSSFGAVGSVTLLSPTSNPVAMVSTAWSSWQLTVPPMIAIGPAKSIQTSIYRVVSSQDGSYEIHVRRAFPDLQQLRFTIDGVTCERSSGSLLTKVILSPSSDAQLIDGADTVFNPATYTYSLTVPHSVTSVSLYSVFGWQWLGNTVSLTILNGFFAAPTAFLPLRTEMTTTQLYLTVGVNQFIFISEADGEYRVTINRAAPSISSIVLKGSMGTSRMNIFPFHPIFSSGSFQYEQLLPPSVTSLVWEVTSRDTSDLLTLRDHTSGSVVTSTIASGSIVDSPPKPVDPTAVNLLFELDSLYDGCYTLDMSHAPPSTFLGAQFTQTHSFGAKYDESAVKMDGFSGLSPSAQAEFGRIYGTDAISATNADGIQTSDMDLTPGFIPGWLGPYTASVSSEVSSVKMMFAFRSGLIRADTPSCTINNAPIRIVTEYLPACAITSINAGILSPDCATTIPLQSSQVNNLKCFTSDGLYEWQITRGAATWTNTFQLPSTLYANQLVTGLPLGVSVGTDARLEWITSDAAVFTPSTWTFSSASSSSSALFSFRAPIISVPTKIYYAPIVTGTDAWALPATGPIEITVLPRGIATLTGIAAYYYAEQDTAVQGDLILTLSESSNRGSDLSYLVTLVDPSSGLLALPDPVATLTFPYGELSQQFNFVLPMSTAGHKDLVLRFECIGDCNHFVPIQDQPLVLLSLSSFHLAGLPSQIYVSKSVTLGLEPVAAPDTAVLVKVTLSGPGLIARTATSAKASTLTFAFPVGSITAAPFIYYAPIDQGSSGIVTFSFTFPTDEDQYLPIPDYSLTIIPAILASVSDVSQSILNRAKSSTMTLTIASAPLNDVTFTFQTDMSDVQFTPSSITFLAGESISQGFIVSAPFWYPEAPTLKFGTIVTGTDAGMFSPPTPVKIQIVQQQATVNQVSFFLKLSDGKKILLSAGLSPFIGNLYKYSFDIAMAIMDPSVSSRGNKLQSDHSSIFLASVGGYTSANASIAILPIFDDGEVTLTVSYASNPDQTVSYILTSESQTEWIPFLPGDQTISLSSSLDGVYTFDYHQTLIANPAQCMSKVNQTSYGLPTESFIQPGTPVSESLGVIPSADASAPPLLVCATVPDLVAAQQRLESAASQHSVSIAFGVSSSPATSWLFCLAIAAYFTTAILAGRSIGTHQALVDESAEAMKQLDALVTAVRGASGEQEGAVLVKPGVPHAPVVSTLQAVTPVAMLPPVPYSLPLSGFILALAFGRVCSMLIHFYFFDRISVPVLRLLTGLPSIMVPCILVSIMQQLPLLLQIIIGGHRTRLHGVPSKLQNGSLMPIDLMSAGAGLVFVLYVYMIAAVPSSDMQILLDIVCLGGSAIVSLVLIGMIVTHTMMLERFCVREANRQLASTLPIPPLARSPSALAERMAAAAGSTEESVGNPSPSGTSRLGLLVSFIRVRITSDHHKASRKAIMMQLLLQAIFFGACVVLLLSVTWSDIYSARYQTWTLLFVVFELGAIFLLLYTERLASMAQREQVHDFSVLLAAFPSALERANQRKPKRTSSKREGSSTRKLSHADGTREEGAHSVTQDEIVPSMREISGGSQTHSATTDARSRVHLSFSEEATRIPIFAVATAAARMKSRMRSVFPSRFVTNKPSPQNQPIAVTCEELLKRVLSQELEHEEHSPEQELSSMSNPGEVHTPESPELSAIHATSSPRLSPTPGVNQPHTSPRTSSRGGVVGDSDSLTPQDDTTNSPVTAGRVMFGESSSNGTKKVVSTASIGSMTPMTLPAIAPSSNSFLPPVQLSSAPVIVHATPVRSKYNLPLQHLSPQRSIATFAATAAADTGFDRIADELFWKDETTAASSSAYTK